MGSIRAGHLFRQPRRRGRVARVELPPAGRGLDELVRVEVLGGEPAHEHEWAYVEQPSDGYGPASGYWCRRCHPESKDGQGLAMLSGQPGPRRFEPRAAAFSTDDDLALATLRAWCMTRHLSWSISYAAVVARVKVASFPTERSRSLAEAVARALVVVARSWNRVHRGRRCR